MNFEDSAPEERDIWRRNLLQRIPSYREPDLEKLPKIPVLITISISIGSLVCMVTVQDRKIVLWPWPSKLQKLRWESYTGSQASAFSELSNFVPLPSDHDPWCHKVKTQSSSPKRLLPGSRGIGIQLSRFPCFFPTQAPSCRLPFFFPAAVRHTATFLA